MTARTPTATTVALDAMLAYVTAIADAADRWHALLDALGLPSDASVADVLATATDVDAPDGDDTGRFLTEVPTVPAVFRDGMRGDA